MDNKKRITINNYNFIGNDLADTILKDIVNKRMQIFKYKNWPFKNQNPEQLELYLYFGNAVQYFSATELLLKRLKRKNQIEKEDYDFYIKNKYKNASLKKLFTNYFYFLPAQIRIPQSTGGYLDIVNKLNIKVSVRVYWGWILNSGVLESLDYQNIEELEKLPFIFDNALQYIPWQNQQQHFQQLSKIYGYIAVNRAEKNKTLLFADRSNKEKKTSSIVGMEEIIYSNLNALSENDVSPNKILPAGISLTDIEAAVKTLPNVSDLYNSLSQELKDKIKYLNDVNGIATEVQTNKTSAQETDTQTVLLNDSIALQNAVKMLEVRKKWIKNFNENYNIPENEKWDVEFSDYYKELLATNKRAKEQLLENKPGKDVK